MKLIVAAVALAVILVSWQPVIQVPVKVHLVTDASGYYTTYRNAEDAERLIEGANGIWSQAGISFSIEGISDTRLGFEAVPNALNGNISGITDNPEYDPSRVNVYLVQSLNNINGFSVPASRIVLVSDYTTSSDYRVAAHELGHVLGLAHMEAPENLMARGRYGEQLSEDEVSRSREAAALIQR